MTEANASAPANANTDAAPTNAAAQATAPVAPAPASAPATSQPVKLTPVEGGLADAAAIEAFANEHKLSGEAAMKAYEIADAGIKAHVAKAQEQFSKQRDEWISSITADPEIGGDKLEATKTYANKALKAFFAPEFITELQQAGYDAHPGLVRGLAKLGKMLSEPTSMIQGSTEKLPEKKTLADLYR